MFFCPSRCFTKRHFLAGVLLFAFWSMTPPILAQVNNQPYNLQIGPVTLRADAGSTVSYNDNINLAQTGREDDWIVTPDFNVHGRWQATQLNILTFDLGVGYQQYILHPSNDSFQIAPDSQLKFQMWISDFEIIFHDGLSYENNPVGVGQVSNVTQFHRLTNSADITVDYDIGDMTLSLEYSHTNFYVFESAYSYLDYQSDAVSPQVSFKFSKTIEAGFGVSLDSTRYDQTVENNYTEITAGPFVSAQLSENLSVIAKGGGEIAQYGQGGSNGDTSSLESYYGSAGITHRINSALSEAVSFGREYIPGLTSNYTDRIYANYTPKWRATSLFNIAPQFWWEHLQDSGGIINETSTRFGAALNLGFTLTEHATVNFGYNYVNKNSNLKSLSYSQDVLTLGLNYQF